MKIVLKIFFAFVAFIIMINLSIKVFNTINPWIGIIAGLLSIIAFIWVLVYFWKKTGIDGKEKKNEK